MGGHKILGLVLLDLMLDDMIQPDIGRLKDPST